MSVQTRTTTTKANKHQMTQQRQNFGKKKHLVCQAVCGPKHNVKSCVWLCFFAFVFFFVWSSLCVLLSLCVFQVFIPRSLVVRISASHADDRGSNPRVGTLSFATKVGERKKEENKTTKQENSNKQCKEEDNEEKRKKRREEEGRREGMKVQTKKQKYRQRSKA